MRRLEPIRRTNCRLGPQRLEAARHSARTLHALLLVIACCGDDPSPAPTGTLAAFATVNSAGRSGAYYLPVGYAGEALPLVLLYHGTGGEGATLASAFAPWADEHRLLIVAPDSRVAPDGQFSWEVGNGPGVFTEDFFHTRALLDELEGLEGVRVDWSLALAAGHSGGGSSAPYFATNDERFNAFGVLHGGVVPGGIGENVVPGWFSTGEDDTLRPPDLVEEHASYMSETEGFPDITLRIYPGGHGISAQERSELVNWWRQLP